MSANDKHGAAADGMTRKERRAAERSTRKSGTTRTAAGNSGGSGRSMVLISLGAIIVGVIVVIGLVVVSGGLGGDSEVSQPDTAAPAEELRQGRTLVAADAVDPVVVEVFEDAQCPHCQSFTERIEPLIIAEYVSDGTASLTYNDYIIFGEDSLAAAVAMRAAEELDGAFWDYQHTLYHNAPDGSFTRGWFVDIAESIGLDRAAFGDLLDDPALVDGVEEDMARGAAYGATGTPAVVIDGELLGEATWEAIDAAIEEAAAS